MKIALNILIVLPALACIAACRQQPGSYKSEPVQTEQAAGSYKIGVNTIEVDKMVGKGKIKSLNLVPVYSTVEGVITEMSLVEGQRVHKNEVLARVDDSECRLEISELESELQTKAYEVKSVLIGMGYTRDSLDKVPASERESVEVMTGYAFTKVKYDNKRQILEKHVIRAPFDGSILDIKVNRHFYARKGEPLFYIMDTEHLIVQFEVLETLVPQYRIGQPVEFTTLSENDVKYSARLLSIAPNVEQSGMVVMTARIQGRYPELRPGMTVFVNY